MNDRSECCCSEASVEGGLQFESEHIAGRAAKVAGALRVLLLERLWTLLPATRTVSVRWLRYWCRVEVHASGGRLVSLLKAVCVGLVNVVAENCDCRSLSFRGGLTSSVASGVTYFHKQSTAGTVSAFFEQAGLV